MSANNVVCEICGKEYSKYGIKNHIDIVHNKTKTTSHKGGRKNPWNKGKNKNTDERILKQALELSNNIKKGRTKIVPHTHTDETKEKLRQFAIKNELGGHVSKKSIWYKTKKGKDVYLQSSYEVSVAESLDENDIEWTRPSYFLWIDDVNIVHRYYPDFYIVDYNVYLDPKNYFLQKKDKRKIQLVQEQNNIKILILSENELNWKNINNKITPL